MACARCDSDNQVEFPSEIAIHFSGRENLDKPHVFAFPNILVCLDCGFSDVSLQKRSCGYYGKGSSRRLPLRFALAIGLTVASF